MDAVGTTRGVVLAAVLLVAACSAPATTAHDIPLPSPAPSVAAPLAPALIPYAPSPRITGTQFLACVARANGMLPDPACTPGAVGSTDPAMVCAAGFADAHRADVRAARAAAIRAYHIAPGDAKRTEYDHLVPLSLGGANDVANLWPQVSDLPNAGIRNSKDGVEFRLWLAVCVRRTVALSDAQAAMARDWTAAEKFLGVA